MAHPRLPPRTLLAAWCCAFVGATGCGADGGSPAPEEPPLIGARALGVAKTGTATRAFLDYWSALQFQSWPTAVSYCDRRLREQVGEEVLVAALSSRVAVYRTGRPRIVRVEGWPTVSITYSTASQEGRRATDSVRLGRDGRGRWKVIYDSAVARVVKAVSG